MKKFLCLIVLSAMISLAAYTQTVKVVSQWTFPNGIDSVDIYPDAGLSVNSKSFLGAEDTLPWPATNLRKIDMVAGASTYAAKATGWDDGNGAKLWAVKFKTEGATNLTVSSKQSSDSNYPGPKYWKIQARISGQDWIDIHGGEVVLGHDWTSGNVTDLPLPSNFDNVTASIFIRWIMISDSNTLDGIVNSDGVSLIDDIVIKGEYTVSIPEINTLTQNKIYPNPNASGKLFLNNNMISRLLIFDAAGKVVDEYQLDGYDQIDIRHLQKGVYFVQLLFNDDLKVDVQKLIVY